MKYLFVLLFLGGCKVPSNTFDPEASPASVGVICHEMTHTTSRDGREVRCRMIYCTTDNGVAYATGGPAVLWCDEMATRVDGGAP